MGGGSPGGRVADADDGLHTQLSGDAEDLSDPGLGCGGCVAVTQTDLHPAAPEVQTLAGQLQNDGGNGAVFDPGVGETFIPENHHPEGRVPEEMGAVGFDRGEFGQQIPVRDKDEFPGVLAPGRGRTQHSLLELVQDIRGQPLRGILAGTAALAQDVEHGDSECMGRCGSGMTWSQAAGLDHAHGFPYQSPSWGAIVGREDEWTP